MKDKRLVEVGLKIRNLRKEQGVSQEKLAELSNTDRSYMGRIERGEKNITILKLYELCDALGMAVHEFFTDINIK